MSQKHFNLNKSERKPRHCLPNLFPLTLWFQSLLLSPWSIQALDLEVWALPIPLTVLIPQCLHSCNQHLWRTVSSRHFSVQFCLFISLPLYLQTWWSPHPFSGVYCNSLLSSLLPILLLLNESSTLNIQWCASSTHLIIPHFWWKPFTVSYHQWGIIWGLLLRVTLWVIISWQLSCFAAVYLSWRRVSRQLSTSPQDGEPGLWFMTSGFLVCRTETSFSAGPKRSRRGKLLCLKWGGQWSTVAGGGCCGAADGSAGGLPESGRRRMLGWGWAVGPGSRPACCSLAAWLVEAGPSGGMVALLPYMGQTWTWAAVAWGQFED